MSNEQAIEASAEKVKEHLLALTKTHGAVFVDVVMLTIHARQIVAHCGEHCESLRHETLVVMSNALAKMLELGGLNGRAKDINAEADKLSDVMMEEARFLAAKHVAAGAEPAEMPAGEDKSKPVLH